MKKYINTDRVAEAMMDAYFPEHHGDYRTGIGRDARKKKKANRRNQKKGRRAAR